MIGMKVMRHHFYLGLICKIVLLIQVGLKSDFYGTSKFFLNLYFCEALLIIVQINGSMRRLS